MLQFPTDFGRYRLTGIAGEGGMATVYRAILPGPHGFEKRMVVKVIRQSLIEDKEFMEALKNEALLGCQLQHPNIVHVYEYNHYKGRYFLAMELVDGISLSYLVKRHRKVGHLIPTSVVLHVMRQIVDGLDYAHNAENEDGKLLHVIHRDLKPSNVAITRNGIVKILDFGIARATLNRGDKETSGAIRGTPRYMSPEQIQTPLAVTPASDLFSLGTVLYELVTLKPLFAPRPGQDPTNLVIHMPLEEQITEVKDYLPGLGSIFERLIARPVMMRYATAAAVDRDLRTLWDEHGDPDRAKIYLGELVGEYKKEIKANEERVPEFFEPGYATGWAPGISGKITGSTTPSLLTATAPMPRADPNDPQATIPLPPRPNQLVTGKLVEIGPRSTNLPTPSTGPHVTPAEARTGSTGTRGTVQRPFVVPGATTSAGSLATTGGSTGTRAGSEEGGNWGVVAALAVPLLVLVIIGIFIGLVFSSRWMGSRGGGGGASPSPGTEDIQVSDAGDAEPAREATGAEPATAAGAASGAVADGGGSSNPAGGGVIPDPGSAIVLTEVGTATGDGVAAEPATPEPATPEPATPAPEQRTTTRTARSTGKIRVDAEPWAVVYVDGRSYGETPVLLDAITGTHKVTLRCMGTGPRVHKPATVKARETAKVYHRFAEGQCPE